MTPDQLSAIRARLDSGYDLSRLDMALLLDEVERLRADPLPAAAWVREVERAAFARGAEAMRTALANRVSWGSDLSDRIRTEPVPEDR